ncbi:esterase OVCA2-like isoform X1 [Clavelina lepadiformis]|uniref:esterase OVCA2-like isoform X1 n=1 Tax=Clavelina lepadiformis TaxID=159417 RepID=UPI004041265F
MSCDGLLKVLCLHGYRQTEKIFRDKTGALRKILKKYCQLVYITAPNVIPSADNDEENSKQTGWWFSTENKLYVAQDVTDCCVGFKESLETVCQILKQDGPFDGIIAFSQGACLLSIICSLKEKGDERFQNLKFAVFFAGFKSRQSQHKCYYEVPITIPSLHVIGDTDQVIQKEMSDDLLDAFTNKTIVRHTGGHFIPTAAPQKNAYIEFMKPFMNRK